MPVTTDSFTDRETDVSRDRVERDEVMPAWRFWRRSSVVHCSSIPERMDYCSSIAEWRPR